MRTPRFARAGSVLLIVVLGSLGLVLGCGGEDDSPMAPVENPAQTLNDNLDEFDVFNDAIDSEPANQMLDDPAFSGVLELVGFDLFSPVAGTVRDGIQGANRNWQEISAHKLTPSAPRVAMLDAAGTYDRDVNDTTEPFPGWVLAEANNPSDGFVFRFQLDDDISYWDEATMTEVPVQGAYRLLEIVVQDGGTPFDPSDDYLQHMVMEVAASADPAPAPTLARLEFSLVVSSSSVRWTIGSPTASSPSSSGASFLGPLLYYVELAVTETASGGSIDAIEQLYHSGERFGARVESGVTFATQFELPATARFVFAVGETSNPAAPPLRIAMNLTNFRPGEFEDVADVNGTITYAGAPLATLVGDTTEVPVDLDGDGNTDGTCVNIQITFADNPGESQNLCEAIGAFDDSILPTAF